MPILDGMFNSHLENSISLMNYNLFSINLEHNRKACHLYLCLSARLNLLAHGTKYINQHGLLLIVCQLTNLVIVAIYL